MNLLSFLYWVGIWGFEFLNLIVKARSNSAQLVPFLHMLCCPQFF